MRWTRNEIRSGRRRLLAAALIVLGPVFTGFGQSADGPARPVAPRPLLLERGDRAAVGPLRLIAAGPRSAPVAVVHALRLLEALDALTDDLLRSALGHLAAPVRESALQLVEGRLARDQSWLADVLSLAGDEDARVRFQAAIALGAAGDGPGPPSARASDSRTDIAAALARIATRDGSDRWARAAVFSSLTGREPVFLTALSALPRDENRPRQELLSELGRLLGASQPRETWPGLVRRIVETGPGFTREERAALLTGLAEAARGRLTPLESEDVLSALIGPASGQGDLKGSIQNLVADMKRIARDETRPVASRLTAVNLLALASFDLAGATLLQVVEEQRPSPLQAAALRALGWQRDDRVATLLLAAGRFATYPPSLRDELLSVLIAQSRHLDGILTAIEDGRVPVGAVDALHRRALAQHRDPEVRRRAARLFGTVQGDRAKVYEAYKDVAAAQPADPANGRAVFRRECASCHRLDQEGYAVGPDLFGIRNQPKPAILLHVLVPDHEITQGFTAYTLATKDGRVLTGLLTSETPATITLRQPLGKEDTILRTDIDEISASRQPLMPQELEKNISRREFTDLLAYLKGEGQPDAPH
jgi:putative heme-binding domain-containing protein